VTLSYEDADNNVEVSERHGEFYATRRPKMRIAYLQIPDDADHPAAHLKPEVTSIPRSLPTATAQGRSPCIAYLEERRKKPQLP